MPANVPVQLKEVADQIAAGKIPAQSLNQLGLAIDRRRHKPA
jgi:hypothetical protein